MRTFTRPEALRVVDLVQERQERFAAEPVADGMPFVYLSDEWYFTTGCPFPSADHYGDFAQLENGVGMTRKLLDEWQSARQSLPRVVEPPRRLAIMTGVMAEPIMARVGRDLGLIRGLDVRIVPVTNRFFGGEVTVAGLLCGQDVLDEALRACGEFTEDDLIVLPHVMLDSQGTSFLDDMSVEDFQKALPARAVFVRSVHELLEAIQEGTSLPV
jgi:NifB/MoaA-like Fe-S oxidoreductase